MLRPIDTQTIYQQTPEVSNRQQAFKQGEEMQQTQFANLLHKEVEDKKKVVIETKEDAKTDNDLNKRQGRNAFGEKKKYKKKKNDTEEEKKKEKSQHFDMRI
ncbi:MAG: hypothetical protein E7231_00835 [Cellulosilyticum sp.]|nr:hypothetical protein [Cellulosilyticum sp.]